MPIFTDPTHFPSFNELPPTSSPTLPQETWYLIAQIREDMTITKPTLIVRDRTGIDFAVTFDDGDHRGLNPNSTTNTTKGKTGFRKGHTLVIPRATRTDRGDGKKAVVRVPAGSAADVRIVPGALERVLEMGAIIAGIREQEKQGTRVKKCAVCGKTEEDGGKEDSLSRCTGCGLAAYCSKECQVRGWNELGHKANCKVIKAIREIWP
ncbi:uncharacterized protein F4822DRAFT_387880 [Hypoxylon trugodes]|uniref:uncharacterized protein n=1 Tax=Hypoxylon trugodes TaxID=326681 RepID=UPI0021954C01|nr:uncharacterized protein F4822DRAFT_387880 [Hypoxylon trugodes]KAI1394313.1 hypothetical protein F4822DRAFT_387880 [Hypoxylon trugodes]